MNTPRRETFWHPLRILSAWLFLACALSLTGIAQAQQSDLSNETSDFEALVHQLVQGNLPQRVKTVEQLAVFEDDRLIGIFTALAAGDLQADRSDPPTVAIVQGNRAVDALSGEAIEDANGLRRVPVHNALRTQLRGLMAQLNLNHESAQVRYDAVRRFIRDGIDAEALPCSEPARKVKTPAVYCKPSTLLSRCTRCRVSIATRD